MTDTIDVTTKREPAPVQALPGKIGTEELAAELVARAGDELVSLVGPGGLLSGLTKAVEAGSEALQLAGPSEAELVNMERPAPGLPMDVAQPP